MIGFAFLRFDVIHFVKDSAFLLFSSAVFQIISSLLDCFNNLCLFLNYSTLPCNKFISLLICFVLLFILFISTIRFCLFFVFVACFPASFNSLSLYCNRFISLLNCSISLCISFCCRLSFFYTVREKKIFILFSNFFYIIFFIIF